MINLKYGSNTIDLKKICIIGGGNVGIAAAIDISQNDEISTILITSKNKILNNKILKLKDSDTNEVREGRNILVTNNYDELNDADVVIITQPSFCIPELSEKMKDYIPKIILFAPGYGGKELYFRSFVEKGCLVGGFDRSLYIARLSSETEVLASKKKTIRLATMDIQKTELLCFLATVLFGINVIPLKNYLTVAFTPSNPILHTARLYSLFKEINFETCLKSNIKFYADWSDYASELLFKMDKELLAICNALEGLDMSGVIPNSVHYESKSVKELTSKITSIKSWHDIDAPVIRKEDGYYVDSNSRYFKEDFPYGLCNLIGFAKVLNVETPTMDEILKWYQRISGIEYFDNNGQFRGSGLHNTCVPQNFGLNTLEDIKQFYR